MVSCTLAHAAVPLRDSSRWPDLSACLESLDKDCLKLDLPTSSVVGLTVGAKERIVVGESATADE